MSVSVRQGYNVWSREPDRVAELKRLESLGIIKLKTSEWQSCKKCKRPNLVDDNFRKERSTTCCNCGKLMQLSKNVDTSYTIDSLNYERIRTLCEGKLHIAIGKENCTYQKERRIWNCQFNGKRFPVFASNFSSYNLYLNEQSDSRWLCILLDWEKEHGNIHFYNRMHFIKLEDILFDKINIKEVIEGLVSSFPANVAEELYQKFDEYIASIKPTEFSKFEDEFVDKFLKGIQTNVDALKAYFNYLSSRKQTIVNSKVVFMGGPANPDFATINLLDYLQEGLKPGKLGEVKRYYRTTPFTVEDFGKALVHSNGGDTVSIVSTNKVQPEVWRSIIEAHNKERYYKHVLIEKDTLLLLISSLKLESLLQTSL